VSKPRGFTLIELMMTLAIMAVLALVSIPLAQTALQRAKEQELRRSLIQVRDAIDAYKKAADQGHIELMIGDTGYPPSLSELVDGVRDMKSPDGRKLYFLRAVPRDPMAANLEVKAEDSWGLRSYASSATDPQPGQDVYDVYSQSMGKGLNGVPYRQW
jgi:general secretion pathway protein G